MTQPKSPDDDFKLINLDNADALLDEARKINQRKKDQLQRRRPLKPDRDQKQFFPTSPNPE